MPAPEVGLDLEEIISTVNLIHQAEANLCHTYLVVNRPESRWI
jgi:hypothetical protein